MTFIRNEKVLSIKHFKGFGQHILVFKSTAIKGNRTWLNLPPTEIFFFLVPGTIINVLTQRKSHYREYEIKFNPEK